MTESKPIRILCMEDDLGLARLFQRRLQREGYAVDLASDGQEGLDMYAEMSYDVVAVDQAMPVYDGLEVIRRMASQGPLPPTIMVTGAGDERTAVEAMKLGARDYIVKDVDGGYLELLPTVIERVLEQERLAAQARWTEEALRESEERLRILFEYAPDAVYLNDLKGTFIDGNRVAQELTGYEMSALIGQSFLKLKLLSARQIPKAAALLARNALGRPTGPDEFVLRRKDGTRVPVEIRTYPVRIKGQTLALGIARDITERKRFDEERERLIADLREALARVRTLSGMLPICAACKKIRDDQGYWQAVERYISEHSEAQFSHGLCPDCMKKLYPEFYEEEESVASGSIGSDHRA